MMQRDLPSSPAPVDASPAPVAGASPPPPAPDTHRGRLFRKYLLLILSLVTIVLLASSGINLYFSYRENRAALSSLQHEKAVGAASRIEQYIRQVSQQLAYASLPQLDAADVEARRIEFLKLLRQAPEVTDIAQLDAAGREQIAVSRLGMDVVASGKDRSAEPAFLRARRGQPWYGPVYFRKETEPYMTIAIRSGGEKSPVTVAEVNLKFIWDVVSRIKIGAKGKAYVVDATGLLVADPDIGLVLRKTNLAALAHVQAAVVMDAEDEVAMVSKDLAGTPVLTSVAAIEPLDWKVFVEQPVAEVYAKLDASIARTGALLLAGLVISALAASALARGMVRPIRTLDEGARRIGAGDLEQRIAIKTGDELEGLADQFNRMTGQLRESYAGLERKVEQRTVELTESLEYQTAISAVLRVISESPTDVAPVFEAILDSATRLFGSPTSAVFRYDGRLVHLAATRNWTAEAIEAGRALWPAPPNPQLMSGRIILERRAMSAEDTHADPSYNQALATAGRWRRMIGAPMLKDGVPVGVIAVAWLDPGQTPPRQLELLKTFADQAAIAIENVRLINETKEALEQQTAIADILQVISSSPTNTQPVFDAIVKACRRLFEGRAVAFCVPRGRMIETVAFSDDGTRGEREGGFLKPWPLDRESAAGACMIDARQINVADTAIAVQEFPRMKNLAIALGYRSGLFIPLLKDRQAIGVIAILRATTGAFTDQQAALARTFADQAVIAIENVRLFNETKEALEQQTATAEVLQVISGSMADARPVFDKILQSCQRLFAGAQMGITLVGDDGMLRLAAHLGSARERLEKLYPRPIDGSPVGLRMSGQHVVHLPDVLGTQGVPRAMREIAEQVGNYSIMVAPMLWEGRNIGSIHVTRQPPTAFADKEIGLLKTFADQAVIAIQNARLFNETKEALGRQTATSAILRVISESPTDVQPVLDAVAERAAVLCDAMHSSVFLLDGDVLRPRASSTREAADDAVPRATVPLKRTLVNARAFLDRRAVHVEDIVPLLDTEYPDVRDNQQRFGFRAMLAVPMLRDDQAIGTIFTWRREPRAFSKEAIALLQTFADQSVIAIENVRLFNETKEALEHQTATADILKVISSSPTDVQPVLDTVAERSRLLCRAEYSTVWMERGGVLHPMSTNADFSGVDPLQDRKAVLPINAASMTGRAFVERRCVHIEDVVPLLDTEYPEMRTFQQSFGFRSTLAVPMLRHGVPVGVIALFRNAVEPFSPAAIKLVQTFADQAVIAIHNVHLFHEIEDKSRQLEIANRHKSEFLANMSHELRTPLNAIIGFSEVLTEQMFGEVNDKQMEYLLDIHSSGQHLLTLINDVLDLSKIEAGRMELELSCFDLGLLLDNSLTLVRERAQRQGLALALDVGDGLEEWVADARKVKQVVVNLLSNAVKFTPTAGSVTVRARRVDVGGNAFAQVSVADTGVGIAPEEQAMVFEEFRQASGDYLRKTEGTGLGLSLAKRFAELHGGTIRIDSARGQGATFTVTLPLLVLEALS